MNHRLGVVLNPVGDPSGPEVAVVPVALSAPPLLLLLVVVVAAKVTLVDELWEVLPPGDKGREEVAAWPLDSCFIVGASVLILNGRE